MAVVHSLTILTTFNITYCQNQSTLKYTKTLIYTLYRVQNNHIIQAFYGSKYLNLCKSTVEQTTCKIEQYTLIFGTKMTGCILTYFQHKQTISYLYLSLGIKNTLIILCRYYDVQSQICEFFNFQISLYLSSAHNCSKLS